LKRTLVPFGFTNGMDFKKKDDCVMTDYYRTAAFTIPS